MIPDHRQFERALSPEFNLDLDPAGPAHSPVGPAISDPPSVHSISDGGKPAPAGSGPVLSTGVCELPDPVGALFAAAPGLAAISWRRLEHFIKGYDAAHDDAQGHDKRKFSLFNLARQRLADAGDFIADGRLSAEHADDYRRLLAYAAAILAAEIDRHDREVSASSSGREAQPKAEPAGRQEP